MRENLDRMIELFKSESDQRSVGVMGCQGSLGALQGGQKSKMLLEFSYEEV